MRPHNIGGDNIGLIGISLIYFLQWYTNTEAHSQGLITSTVGDKIEELQMAHAQSVDVITDGFFSPTLPEQPVKPIYGSIRDTHCLLTVNAALINSPRGRVKNGHLRLVLTTTQYALVSRDPFICPTDPGHTPSIPVWTTPFNEKALLWKHAKQC